MTPLKHEKEARDIVGMVAGIDRWNKPRLKLYRREIKKVSKYLDKLKREML